MGKFPSLLKNAIIIGIFKGGDKSEPCNYRPIALTSHLSKLMERVVRKELVDFLDTNGLWDRRQHGSRSGHSTLSQLLDHQDYILSTLEEGHNLDVVYLDFAKAYDKVDHSVLLHKIRALGIEGKLGSWIGSFLLDRTQEVKVEGSKSRKEKVISGVPQGSVLGP